MIFTNNALRWLETLLRERFGHHFKLVQQPHLLSLALPGAAGEIRFDNLQEVFHQSHSDFPCKQWQASSEGYITPIEGSIPAPSESDLPQPLIEHSEDGAKVHYDILGLTYWMLTRLEEVGRKDLDSHMRFPATASHAYRNDYLKRPIVDEWLIVLGKVIMSVWPYLRLNNHQFSVNVSHDVDRPTRYGFRPFKQLIRAMAGDVLKYNNYKGALIAPWVRLNTKKQLHFSDPFNTFQWLMDVSEEKKMKSAFYFICGRTDLKRDADYDPEHPVVRNLMRRIHERGHEIGLHPSYATFQNPELIAQEFKRLKRICTEEGIQQDRWGGRMHYLRWEQPTTLCALGRAGINYDSTLGYADYPGFRCGTCHEFPAFDPVRQISVDLRIRPLIAMECSIIASSYMGLGCGEESLAKFQELKNSCRSVKGCFTLLWHNSELCSDESKRLYLGVIA